jgi:hypothetical protein
LSRRTDIRQNKFTYIKLVKFSEANDSVHVHAFSSLKALSYMRKMDSTLWGSHQSAYEGPEEMPTKIVSTMYGVKGETTLQHGKEP